MTTEEWLKRGWKLNQEIDSLLEERNHAFDLACKITAETDRERVQTSQINTSEEKFVKYVAYTEQIDSRIDALYGVKLEIERAINQVKDATLRTLLRKRYLACNTWEQIAADMHYSWRWLMKLHEKALSEIKRT